LPSGWGSAGISREYGLRIGCVSVRRVAPPADALAHLTEISTQIEAAVVFDREGTVLGSIVDDERAGTLAAKALELFRTAEGHGGEELVQLDAAFPDGTVFVVRDADRLIAATTGPEPTVGLVFYDLKTCLRGFSDQMTEPKSKPKPKPKAKAAKATKTATRRQTTTKKKAEEAESESS